MQQSKKAGSQMSIVSKMAPKKAPTFAEQQNAVGPDNYGTDDRRSSENEIDEEMDTQERGPNIDEQKDDQSDEQKLYGNFINEENQHRRELPPKMLSDSDSNAFLSSGNDDDPIDDFGIEESLNSAQEKQHSSQGFQPNEENSYHVSYTYEEDGTNSYLSDPSSDPFERESEGGGMKNSNFIFRSSTDEGTGGYQGKQLPDYFRTPAAKQASITDQIKEKEMEKKKRSAFNDKISLKSPYKSRFRDDTIDADEQRKSRKRGFYISKFFDPSVEDIPLKPHDKGPKEIKIGKIANVVRFGNKYLDQEYNDTDFDPKPVHHTPSKRRKPHNASKK